MAFNFAPKGWATCSGQTLSIQENTALFSLIGTTYGGNGVTNFGLPDLRSRVPMHFGSAPDGESFAIGQRAGEETVTLTTAQMPIHIHTFNGTTPSGGVERQPLGGLLGKPASGANNYYASVANPLVALDPLNSILAAGGSQPHSNMQPYLVMNFCIALIGIFPSRN